MNATETLHLYAEFKKGTSNKFYEVLVEGKLLTFKWGRIGTTGQSKSEECFSFERACRTGREQFATKTAKGYVECSSRSPLLALVSALEEPEERKVNGLPPVALAVPLDWQMYSPAGNARMREFAEKYVAKMNLIRASVRDLKPKQAVDQANAVLRSYVGEWQRIGETKQFAEATDTAVREVVGDFFDRLREGFGVPSYALERWGSLY